MIDEPERAPTADQGLNFGPSPDGAVERDVPTAPLDGEGAVRFLLVDDQVDLRGGRTWSIRRVQRVQHPEGVAQAASFRFTFDPSVCRAVVHHVRVVRGDAVRDALDPASFQLLRREPNLERRVYDGALTADLQIPDIRPGDVVDTWFTIVGARSLNRDHFDATFVLGWSEPVEETSVRVHAPAGRPLAIRLHPDDGGLPEAERIAHADGSVEYAWRCVRLPAFIQADATPPEWVGRLSLQVADVRTWNDIARALAPLYLTAAPLASALSAEAAATASAEPDAAGRLIAAYRLVQREVRYLAVNLGNGGLVPRAVDAVWSRRAGDCKDVSRLLVALLGDLGIEATPALVRASGGARLSGVLPGLQAFDHCIVRFRLGDRVGWLDATGSASGGDLDHLTPAYWGFALPLAPDGDLVSATDSLEAVERLEIREVFDLGPDPTSPATLEVRSSFQAWSANSLRAALRDRGLTAIQKEWQKAYAGHYGGVAESAPMTVDDDLRTNTIRTVERYVLAGPWKSEGDRVKLVTVDDVVRQELPILPEPGRSQPLALGRPRRIRKHTELRMPVAWSGAGWDTTVDTPGVRGWARAVIDGRNISLDIDIAFTAPSLHGPDLAQFREAMLGLREGAAITLSHTVKDGKFYTAPAGQAPQAATWDWLRWLFLAVLVLRVLVAASQL